jgi:heme exporter protein C
VVGSFVLKALFSITAVSLLASLFFVLLLLPFEATQGPVQKIFFFHVPSAFAMYFFAVLGVVFSIVYLLTRKTSYDLKAQASMRCSLLFGVLVILSGPIWAKPVWGVYWTWDPRLTLSFVVLLLLLSYVFVRSLLKDRQLEEKARLIGAILSILAIPFMILTHLSVKLWRGLHPSVLRNPEGLDPQFSTGLQIMTLSIFLLGLSLFFVQGRLLEAESKIEELERQNG